MIGLMEDLIAKQQKSITFRDVEWNECSFTGNIVYWETPNTNGNTCFTALLPITMVERLTVQGFKIKRNTKRQRQSDGRDESTNTARAANVEDGIRIALVGNV